MLKELEGLSKKYNFDYDFVSDFGESLSYDHKKLSKVCALSTNPKELLETCNTVIVVVIPYEKSIEKSNIASFSWKEDYHIRTKVILNEVSQLFDNSIYTIDSNVLNERYFANKSNIGYIGKNSMFISDKYGSYCYIGLVLIEEVISSKRITSLSCNDCTKCIEICPVGAIKEQIDCRKCISERLQSRSNLDFNNIGTNIYGCDVCQDVCPHNTRKSSLDGLKYIDYEDNLFITKKEFIDRYCNFAFYWIGYRTFIRNVHIAYINKTKDYSKIEFLRNSNSDYLRKIYDIIMEEKNG